MTLIITTVSEAVAAGRRRRSEEGNFRGTVDTLFESAVGEHPGPQVLIVRQIPGWTLPVHFHMQHQFQVVLRGSGTLGRHPLLPGSVHYSSPQSGYGPIFAGEDGLDYFTIRILTDRGAWYLPERRAFMERGIAREQQWGNVGDTAAEGGWQPLIAHRPDGLGAWSFTGRSGADGMCMEPAIEAGRFHAVVRGGFLLGDRMLPPGSCVYSSAPDAAPAFTAAEDDSLLVVVQFPGHAVQHHVPPELRAAPAAGTPAAPGVPL